MHSHQKTIPQKPTKQATRHTGRCAQTTHTSQRNAFTAYLPSLHLSNHTHCKSYHTPTQHPSPSTITSPSAPLHYTTSPYNNHPHIPTYNNIHTKPNTPHAPQNNQPKPSNDSHRNTLCTLTSTNQPQRFSTTHCYNMHHTPFTLHTPSHPHQHTQPLNTTHINVMSVISATEYVNLLNYLLP